MKNHLLALLLIAAGLAGTAQTQPMKFMGVNLNCTMTTFMSKMKGKGFTQDPNSHDNVIYMKGVFAGERVRIEVHNAPKTKLISSVLVRFNHSTSYSYDILKKKLQVKYGTDFTEVKNLKEEDIFVKYTTNYTIWNVNKDTVTGNSNQIVLSQCSYRSTSPLVISYIDFRNSRQDREEIDSDF